MQKIQPPQWESFVYLMDQNNQCQKIHHTSDKESQQFYKQQLSENPHSAKLMLAQGNIEKQDGPDQNLIQQCIGQALFDGNLKRKTFQPGNFYVVNQKNLGGQTYNVV